MKEEQEALKAAIYLRQLQEENTVIEDDLGRCEEEIAQEDALRKALKRLQKEEALQGPRKEEAQKLFEALEKEELLEKELQEAIDASYVVTDKLKHAVNELDSASSWGIYDVIGGGMLASMAKHSHVDNAQQNIAQIQQDMRRFQKELQDISTIELPAIQMEDWLKFTDIFFDHMIFDFMALSRINQGKDKLKMGLDTLIQLQDQLLNEKLACLERKHQINEDIAKLYQ